MPYFYRLVGSTIYRLYATLIYPTYKQMTVKTDDIAVFDDQILVKLYITDAIFFLSVDFTMRYMHSYLSHLTNDFKNWLYCTDCIAVFNDQILVKLYLSDAIFFSFSRFHHGLYAFLYIPRSLIRFNK